ncbi:NADPH-dependent 2,4-dienoyl-CoA reductase/sulfur reductase-like enzyme [Geomicrobium halophilum]|uniref:NADPH-dependent 2,4-dienoyl-CoA reductase/sulfur reductase-like enzyme n=1 Tax=Geomicrobium halophilum TaxID=549000 RepID=A0A841PP02_9BACL|nr:FAD-dependent oxidoreductase [Geomicrobium halophilum]MBB6450479.1 NADPH-dependent 2,4-dienoyl-CoA reductase/sulfur reductase-like enzyme [Geomicrobium halophilum]
MKRYVIIGGDAAGMSAAMQIVRRKGPGNAQITTLERGTIYSYAQCGLPYVIEGSVLHPDDLIARSIETFREEYGIDARTEHEVKNVDTQNQEVHGIDRKSDQPFTITYDKLLIASGADPILPPLPGTDAEGVHTLKTIPDLKQLRKDMHERHHLTIVGGGYVGLELAEAFKTRGFNVLLIDRNKQLAKVFDPDMAELLQEETKDQGIDVRLGKSVTELKTANSGRVSAVCMGEEQQNTDLVVFATGIKPNTSFLETTDIMLSEKGAINVNAQMQTNVKDVYAAGDCALQYHRIKEQDDYLPLGTHANKQGRIAGTNMSGEKKYFQGVVGTAIFRFLRLTAARTGLSKKEAENMGLPADSVYYKGTDIAGYFNDKKPIHIKLVYRTDNQLLLGSQVIGESGVDKRIDVLATALYHNMSIDEFENLDLSYAPPYNGVWDPMQQAARRVR